MSHPQDGGKKPEREPKLEPCVEQGNDQDAELLRAQDLLARTLRFLRQCTVDPLAALAAENPRELIRELEALQAEPQTKPETSIEPRTIPLRHRRSA